jgi:coenzyme F420 biosynthesis associated uncharacterized protein
MVVQRGVLVLGAIALGVIGGVAAARPVAHRDLVDWHTSRRIARRLVGQQKRWEPDAALKARYQLIVERSFEAVARYTDMPTTIDRDVVRILDRIGWIDANLANFQRLLRPVADVYGRPHPRSGLSGHLLTRGARIGLTGQVGIGLGYLGRRVLGQYDVPILQESADSSAICFVDPNIEQVAAQAGVDADDVRLWVALHETTHVFQFRAGEPAWLEEHMAGLLKAYLGEAVRLVEASGDVRARLQELWQRLNRHEISRVGIVRLVLTEVQLEKLQHLQALMTVMEGYSNHVMRAVGADVVPGFNLIETQMRARVGSRGPVLRVLSQMLGLEMKMEQYRVGEKFVQYVVDTQGLRYMNRVWDGPEKLPTLAETYDPDAWIARMAIYPNE